MKNIRRLAILILFAGIIAAYYIYKNVYNKSHPDYAEVPTEVKIAAQSLYADFIINPTTSREAYEGKIVEITGNPDNIEQSDTLWIVSFTFGQDEMGLPSGIRCTMLPTLINSPTHLIGTHTTIKGLCNGFNGTDVIFEYCSIISQ